jgi:uncharacterized membrane protein
MRRPLIVPIAATLVCVIAGQAPAAEFIGLGKDTFANGISRDGSVIVGSLGSFQSDVGRWTRQDG